MAITWVINNEMTLESPESGDDYVVNITFTDADQGITSHTRNIKLNNKSDTDEGKAEIQDLIDTQIQLQHDAGTLPLSTPPAEKWKDTSNNVLHSGDSVASPRPTISSFKQT